MAKGGVYAVGRGVWDHEMFDTGPFSVREAWLWMIGAASYEAEMVWVGTHSVALERGQLACSVRYMAKRFRWEDSRVRRLTNRLEIAKMITLKTTNKTTIITLCNYNKYQFERRANDEENDKPVEQKTTSRPPQRKKETNKPTTQYRKKEGIDSPPLPGLSDGGSDPQAPSLPVVATEPEADPFDAFWEIYPKKVDKADARKVFAGLLKSKTATAEQLWAAARQYATERRGQDPQFTRGPARWMRAGSFANEPQAPALAGASGGRRHFSDGMQDGITDFFRARQTERTDDDPPNPDQD